jgi:hypothetical protein
MSGLVISAYRAHVLHLYGSDVSACLGACAVPVLFMCFCAAHGLIIISLHEPVLHPRRLLRSSRPQEICQPRREGFFSVHGLSGCVHSQLQLLRNIFRLFSLYRGSSWSSIQQQWQLSERDHKMKYCAVLNCSNSSKVAICKTYFRIPHLWLYCIKRV